eukprot:UN00042
MKLKQNLKNQICLQQNQQDHVVSLCEIILLFHIVFFFFKITNCYIITIIITIILLFPISVLIL